MFLSNGLMSTELIVPSVKGRVAILRETSMASAKLDLSLWNGYKVRGYLLSLFETAAALKLSRDKCALLVLSDYDPERQLPYQAGGSLEMNLFMFDAHDDDPEGMTEVDFRAILKRQPVEDHITDKLSHTLPEGEHGRD